MGDILSFAGPQTAPTFCSPTLIEGCCAPVHVGRLSWHSTFFLQHCCTMCLRAQCPDNPRDADAVPGGAGAQNQYTQIYGPLGKGDNYTSPLLHTIKLTGLSPKTKYYYQCAPGAPLPCLQPTHVCGPRLRGAAFGWLLLEALGIICRAGNSADAALVPLKRHVTDEDRTMRSLPTGLNGSQLDAAGSATASPSPRSTSSRPCPPWAPTSLSKSS